MKGLYRWAARMAAVLAVAAGVAQAQVPSKINYQGRLLKGTNLVNGVTNITVQLYTTLTGGVPIYTQINSNVVVSDGLYSFYIGDEASGLATALTNSPVYLELAVGGQALSPREAIGSVAYAMVAAGLQSGSVTAAMLAPGAVGTAQLADGAVDSAKILDGSIADEDLATGIQPSKIQNTALTGATTFSGDVSGAFNALNIAPGAVGGVEIQDGSIGDSDISATANIQPSKIQNTALTGATTFSGDVSGTFSTLSIFPGAVGVAELNTTEVDGRYLMSNRWSVADSTTNYVRRTGDKMSGSLDMGGYVVSNGIFYGNGAGLSGVAATVNIPFSNVVWVAVNGTASGPGTFDKPYDTPQNGYNAAGAAGAVVIASGSYFGNLNMNKSAVHVSGLGRPVLMGSLTYGAPAAMPGAGRVLVQNLTFGMGAIITSGNDLKLFNCRIEGSTTISSSTRIELQSCCLNSSFGTALQLQAGNDVISINNSTIESISQSAIQVQGGNTRLEVMGCEVATASSSFSAIDDQQLTSLDTQHLYTHNHIQSAKGGNAVYAMGNGTIAFFHNTVQGNLAGPVNEYFANNTVVGAISWGQADGGATIDAWGNVKFTMPQLPDPWED